MKTVKILLITAEICCIVGIILLQINTFDEDGEFFKRIYTILFSLCAVVLQSEQQKIDWNEDSEVKL